jgi:anti-sigma regulatory factor (Ser/Thr protein kinase)
LRRFLNLKKDQSNEGEDSIPSLPNDISYDELIHRTKRGFIAKKIATYLEIDQAETDRIYFLSLSEANFHYDDHPAYQIIYYSECLLEWIKNGEKVETNVDALPIDNRQKNAILKVYDIHHKQLVEKSVAETPPSTINVDEKWSVYRDVMYSATQGKFVLITKEEMDVYKQGDILVEQEIKVIADIPKCRDAVKQILESSEYSKSDMMSWLLVISEAITNTLKHAEEGKLVLIEDNEKKEIIIFVEDNGSGFDLETLPRKTLMAGFSTKKSLGQGFNLMLKMSKQVLLYTSDQGSTIILRFEARKNGEMLNGAV